MNRKLPVVIFLLLCCHARAENQKDYIGSVMQIPDETQRMAYVRNLATNEVWLLASQAFDKGWDSYGVGAILTIYFGDITLSRQMIDAVIRNKSLNPKLRGSLATAGFETGRTWKIEDSLQYFDSAQPLLNDGEITEEDKIRIAEYSYRAFSRCLSEVRALSDTNATKSVLLNACHTRAQGMMKAISATVEGNPKELSQGTMAKALEDYANAYEHTDFPNSPQLQEAVREATKAHFLLRKHRKPGVSSGPVTQ